MRTLPAALLVSAGISALLGALILGDDEEAARAALESAPRVTAQTPQRPALVEEEAAPPPRRVAVAPVAPVVKRATRASTPKPKAPTKTQAAPVKTAAPVTRAVAPTVAEAKGPDVRVQRRAQQTRRVARLSRRYGLAADGVEAEALEDLVGGGEDLFDKWQAPGERAAR